MFTASNQSLCVSNSGNFYEVGGREGRTGVVCVAQGLPRAVLPKEIFLQESLR